MKLKPRVRPKQRTLPAPVAEMMAGWAPASPDPVLRIGSGTSHMGASQVRNMADWNPVRGSPDGDLLPDHGDLVARSRDLERNSGVAAGGIQTIVDNVVGTGLRLTPRPNYQALGWTKEQADALSQAIYALWIGYADTTACDAADSEIFDSMTAQVEAMWCVNGEAAAIPLWIPGRGDSWSTKLLCIEADRICNPDHAMDSDTIRAGIEFEPRTGMPLAYHVKNAHPGDFMVGARRSIDSDRWTKIKRRGPFGRMGFLHMYDRGRPGQSRGKPLMAPIMREFKQQDRYVGAEIDAAVVNAAVAGIITTPMDQEAIESLFQSTNDRDFYLAQRKAHAVGLSPGSLIPLFPGDTLQPFMPARPATAFAAFVENILRIMGVGMGLPYELLMKDFSKTNYSSARASMLEAWRTFNRRRDALGTKWGDPIYMLWLEEAINAGRIEGLEPNDFYGNRAAVARCRWIGPGRGWIDEVKEITAAKMRIDAGISTLEDECARQGVDWREVAEQRATERDFLKTLGFTPEQAVVPGTRQDPNTQARALAEHFATADDEARQPVAA